MVSRSLRSSAEKRLVEQQELRPHGERARHRDALLLAARQGADRAAGEVGEMHEREEALSTARAISAAPAAARLEPEGDVLGDGEMGEQRVVLEHHADVAPVRRQALMSSPSSRTLPRSAAAGRR